MRNRGRWLAAVLLGVLLFPPPGVLADSAHGCSETVCACAHHGRTPERPARPACHGVEAAKPQCGMRAACAHELPALATAPPYLLPDAAPVPTPVASEAAPRARSTRTTRGHPPVEPPPPEPA